MRISWNLLKTFIDADLTPREAADILTSTGLEVESIEELEPVKGMLKGVVVGHVVERQKHPDADRLSVCDVDLGAGEPERIVCGAPNVAAGQKVLVATIGTTLHLRDGGSITIKKAKIRGVESNGMICAEDELGLGESHAGILVLDPAAPTGQPAAEHLGLRSDHILEIGLTPNRSDAMGHLGVARDLLAALNFRTGTSHALRRPSVDAFAPDDRTLPFPVEVQAPRECPRYAGLSLTGVKVAPSPAWLQDALRSLGLKPVNNVVDVTNFVQHELGQPLHVFDAAQLRGGRVIVRHLPEGTPFTTLDGKERNLSSDDLMICDAEGPACMAGVFGGLHSGVTDATTSVFLESACFDAASVRRTARRHGLHTDASFRFERGVDPEITVYALKRAALLLKQVAGARISSDPVDLVGRPTEWKTLTLPLNALNALIGQPVPPETVIGILRELDMRVQRKNENELGIDVPPYRVDVHRPADVIEEVLRILGFDRIALPERLECPPMREPRVTLEKVRAGTGMHLAARGFREIMSPSLVNGAEAVRTGAIAEGHAVRLKNPLSAELDMLRPTLLFGGLQSIAHNQNRQMHDLRFFEHGRVYTVEKGAVRERERTALWITGRRGRERWRSGADMVDAFDLKAEIELLLERNGWLRAAVETAPHALLHEAVDLRVNGRTLAVVGEVSAPVVRAFGIQRPVFFAEIADDAWMEALRAEHVEHQDVPRFPAVRRDLSVLLDEGVGFAQLEHLVRNAETRLLRQVDLFDVYQGDKLPKGRKSYALSFVLQDDERTLTDEVVEKTMARIREALERGAGAELRG